MTATTKKRAKVAGGVIGALLIGLLGAANDLRLPTAAPQTVEASEPPREDFRVTLARIEQHLKDVDGRLERIEHHLDRTTP